MSYGDVAERHPIGFNGLGLKKMRDWEEHSKTREAVIQMVGTEGGTVSWGEV